MSGAIIIHLQDPLELMEHQAAGKEVAYAEAEAIFKDIFTTCYKNLHYYAYTIVRDETTAEEMVQNVFCRLWERKEALHIQKVTQAYLYKAVYHESMNFLKHARVRTSYQAKAAAREDILPESSADQVDLKMLRVKADEALNELPEQCRTIFQLSRHENLKYREIARKLGISVKTVEAQMSKALKVLRIKLADYLPLLWLCIIGFKK